MRLECPMHGKAQLREGQQIAYRDGNFAGRIGWHEVTVVGDRLAVLASDAPAQSLSARLTSYPANLLQSPLDQRTASFQVGGPTPSRPRRCPRHRRRSRVASATC
jgi:hypothetical protein